MNNKIMTLGEFRKMTNHLSDDIKLNFHYSGVNYPVKSMLSIDELNLSLGGGLYGVDNIIGSINVATFCKHK